MDPADRRAFLAANAVVTTSALPGCPGEGNDEEGPERPRYTEEPPQEQACDAENPFSISVANDGERTETVEVEMFRDSAKTFEDTISVDAGARTDLAEFETTGRYRIRAETDDHRMETSADIERENLTTRRAASGRIAVNEERVLIEVVFDD